MSNHMHCISLPANRGLLYSKPKYAAITHCHPPAFSAYVAAVVPLQPLVGIATSTSLIMRLCISMLSTTVKDSHIKTLRQRIAS